MVWVSVELLSPLVAVMTTSFSPKEGICATKEKVPSSFRVTSPCVGEVTSTCTPGATLPEMVTVSVSTVEGVEASSSMGTSITGRVMTMSCVTDLQPSFITTMGMVFSPVGVTSTL